jgi:hypothetical protein
MPESLGEERGAANVPVVVVSYATADLSLADSVRKELGMHGVRAWMSAHDIAPGTLDWDSAIRSAMRESVGTVLVSSPAAVDSKYVKAELALSVSLERTVFPLWLSGEEWPQCVPLSHGVTQHIDCRAGRFKEGIARAASRIKSAASNGATGRDGRRERLGVFVPGSSADPAAGASRLEPKSARGGRDVQRLFIIAAAIGAALFVGALFSSTQSPGSVTPPIEARGATTTAEVPTSHAASVPAAPQQQAPAEPSPVTPPAPAPPPAPVAAALLDVTGPWISPGDGFAPRFQQTGTLVSVRANMGTDEVVMVGRGQWVDGALNVNFNLLTAPGDQYIANGSMTLSPSADRNHLIGVQKIGAETTNLDLQRSP